MTDWFLDARGLFPADEWEKLHEENARLRQAISLYEEYVSLVGPSKLMPICYKVELSDILDEARRLTV